MSTNVHAATAGATPTSARFRFGRHRSQDDAAAREATPGWSKYGLAAVLVLAGILSLWGLSHDGYSNTYYAAAVKTASVSWKAMFFGSLDPSSFITVDKPPLSIWAMGLSTRILGFSSFAMLLPQAL